MASRSIALAGLLAVSALGGCASQPVVSGSPRPRPPGPGGSPAAEGTRPATPGIDWTRVELAHDVALQLSAVVAVDDGFVATGSRGQAGELPVALHSPDGTTWTPEPIEARFGSPSGLIAWGDRVLGIGNGETGRECAHPSAMDTWVRSADGSWAEAPFDPLFCDNGGTLAAQRARVWLAGSVRDIPSLMETVDGLHWTSRSDRLAGLYPRAAAVDDRGLWVFASDLAGGSVALSSPDGRTFERRPIAVSGGQPVDVLAAPVLDGEVRLIVTSGDSVGVLRALADGSWEEVQSSGLPAPQIAAIVVVAGHLLALGSDDGGLPLAFASADGAAWTSIRLPAEDGRITLNGLAVRNGTAIIVGQIEAADGSGTIGAAWSGSSSLLDP